MGQSFWENLALEGSGPKYRTVLSGKDAVKRLCRLSAGYLLLQRTPPALLSNLERSCSFSQSKDGGVYGKQQVVSRSCTLEIVLNVVFLDGAAYIHGNIRTGREKLVQCMGLVC